MTRRRFAGLAITTVAASLLAACGGGAAPPAATSAPAKPTEAPKPTTAAPAAASPAAGASPAAAAASPAAGASPSAAASPAAAASPIAAASPAASPAAAAAPAGPLPAAKAGAQLKILLWSHFVPAYDEWIDKFAADWGAKNKVEVKVDHIRNADIPARLAAEASAGAGHDLFEFQAVIQTQTYADRLVDLTDVANAIGQKYGGWLDTAKNIGIVQGQWKAIMTYMIMQPHLYRKDYFKEVGADKFPDDYVTLLDLSEKLKANGHPCGLPLANCNDGNHNWRSVMYSFGGTEQSPDGMKVTLASDETLAAIKYGVDLFNKGMTDEVFSWDDTGNNLLLLSGRGSWVDNATSAYITARNQAPDVYNNSAIALQPKGPGAKGQRRNGVDSNAWGVWKWANDPDTAKAFIVDWFAQWQEWGKVTSGYNSPPLQDMWKKPMPGLEDPNFQIMQDWREVASVAGYPGPFSSSIEEVNSTFVLPNMFLRAVRGETPDAAMKWGESEYKRIFQKHGVANP
jgi:multiple sugar transport system substrate-binding protein